MQIEGDYRIAQYGQWDGGPHYQGMKVLRFAKAVREEAAISTLIGCAWLTKEETDKVNEVKDWPTVFPYLSRDCGADILWRAMTAPEPLKLVDERAFANDSLFCEWAYVLDYDARRFEVYKGFNKLKNPATSRFPSQKVPAGEKKKEYQPVRLLRAYSFDALPTEETFLRETDEDAEGEATFDPAPPAIKPVRVRMKPQRVLG